MSSRHEEELGHRTIKSIRVWNDEPKGDLYTPSMLLEIDLQSLGA